MLIIRKANKEDNPQILSILNELDLYYATVELKDFWVAEENNQIIGTVQIVEHEKYYFMFIINDNINYITY